MQLRKIGAVLVGLLSLLIMLVPSIVSLPGALLSIASMRSSPDGRGREAFYDALTALQSTLMPIIMPGVTVTCMNYGWAHATETAPDLVGDEMYCLQMYDAVVRAAVRWSFDASVQTSIGSSAGGVLAAVLGSQLVLGATITLIVAIGLPLLVRCRARI